MQDRVLSPIAIGGVGGSGTRLIASLLQNLGYYIGGDLNREADNLWFTLLFKRFYTVECSNSDFKNLYGVFRNAMYGSGTLSSCARALVDSAAEDARFQHDVPWLTLRAASLNQAFEAPRENPLWGWKEPNTHVVLQRLIACEPGLRYIHVMRNGMDMAYSANQNQLGFWGPRFLGKSQIEPTPFWSLKYWAEVHRRVSAIGAGMGSRFLMFNYDRLCAEPATELPRLLNFFGFEAAPDRVRAAASMIQPPDSIGRYKSFSMDAFDPGDVRYAETLGFPL